jgi:peptidoglycan hydrolase-like protein with peptidoglycan-binding domain
MRRLALLTAVLAAGVVGGVIVTLLSAEDGTQATQPSPLPVGFADVVRTDLVQTETLDGSLRFADPSRLVSQVAGTITDLPEEGAFLEIGDSAFEIDGVQVELFEGDRPAWRPFVDGMSDGADVEQLERNLGRFGFDPGEPDRQFDEDTVEAIEAWQEDRGVEVTGRIDLGHVAFVESGYRVGVLLALEGAAVAPGSPVYEISSLDQEVVIELDPDDLDLVTVGAAVTVVLPDNRRVPGEITDIGKVVRRRGPEPDGPEILDVIVSIDTTSFDLERAPVEVEVESDRASGVLAVPVRALLSLSDGGYAVELRDGETSRLVGVTIGDFAGGLVEVDGDLAEGDAVVVPAG